MKGEIAEEGRSHERARLGASEAVHQQPAGDLG